MREPGGVRQRHARIREIGLARALDGRDQEAELAEGIDSLLRVEVRIVVECQPIPAPNVARRAQESEAVQVAVYLEEVTPPLAACERLGGHGEVVHLVADAL